MTAPAGRSVAPKRLPLSAVLGHGDLGASLIAHLPAVSHLRDRRGLHAGDERRRLRVAQPARARQLIEDDLPPRQWRARPGVPRLRRVAAQAESRARLAGSGRDAARERDLRAHPRVVHRLRDEQGCSGCRLLWLSDRAARRSTSSCRCGAGVYEELVFRLGVCAGGAALLRVFSACSSTASRCSSRFSARRRCSRPRTTSARPASRGSFSVFIYRTLAGLLFATIFYYRSLAHAAYTHALYDIYVMVIR